MWNGLQPQDDLIARRPTDNGDSWGWLRRRSAHPDRSEGDADCMTKPKKEMIHPLYLVFSVRLPMGSVAK